MTADASSLPRIIGAYELLEQIAEGGMGTVYKARSQLTGDIVAIKIIPADTAKNPVLLKRFEQEFKAASLLDHPNVVRAIEYCGSAATPFLVMEYVDGESLGRRVERDGPLPEALALQIIIQICEGLHRAHKQGLIHRDVKPDNILVGSDGRAKLTDLGLVKDVEGELNLTRTGRGLGTPHFMAPEQFRNAKNADVRCDVYSLGATLYMMLTGVIPFAKTNPLECWMRKIKNDLPPPRKLNRELSERVNWAVMRAMSADPAQRPASCREFVEDLIGQSWDTRSSVPVSSTTRDELWYLIYKNPEGVSQKVKGTMETIRHNVKARTLGNPESILVARSKQGPFAPLKNHPEFRDLVIKPAPIETGKGTGRRGSPAAAVDTMQAIETVPQTVAPRRSVDPAAEVPTEPHAINPMRAGSLPSSTAPHRPPTAKLDYTFWLLLALAVSAVCISFLLVILWR